MKRYVVRVECEGTDVYIGAIEAFNRYIEKDVELINFGMNSLRMRETQRAIMESNCAEKVVKFPIS